MTVGREDESPSGDGMTVYVLVNPSDPVTYGAESDRIAAYAAVLLSPAYGVTRSDGTIVVPPFCDDVEGEVGAVGVDDIPALHTAYASFLYGSPSQREVITSLLAAVPDDEVRSALRDRWNDQRTSMTDICGAAREKRLRARSDSDS